MAKDWIIGMGISASAPTLGVSEAGAFVRGAFRDASARAFDPELAAQYRGALEFLNRKLGFRERLCMVRFYAWGWTQEEVALDLQVSKATVQRDLERVRQMASEFIGGRTNSV